MLISQQFAVCVCADNIRHWSVLLAAAHVINVSRRVWSLPHQDLDNFTSSFSTHLLTKGLSH